MSNALRPSELFPLRWRSLLEETHALDIQETVYKGKIRSFGKTKGSLTKVPIADILGFPKLNFQVIRRTIATLGKTKGHPKTSRA